MGSMGVPIPYSHSEQGVTSQNVARCVDSSAAEEVDNPSRPSSRLGFNRTILSLCSSDTSPDSKAVQWTHSLFQNVGISELRLSSIKASTPTVTGAMAPVEHQEQSRENVRDDLQSSVTNVDPVILPPNSSAGNSCISDDTARTRVVPCKSPKKSVSRLSFPFVTTHSPRNNKSPSAKPPSPPPSPPPRHQYSCSPSSLSPWLADRPSPKLARHNYPEHGYSKSALQHIKWFWSMKEEALDGHRKQDREESIYEVSSNAPKDQAVHPMTIHPRRGDISAIRDPYVVDVDRLFVGLPTWTIGKVIWMHDLHIGAEKRCMEFQQQHTSNKDDESGSDDDESDSDADMETFVSTGFGDDSDATLVESESETDLPHLFGRVVSVADMKVPLSDKRRFSQDLIPYLCDNDGTSSTVLYQTLAQPSAPNTEPPSFVYDLDSKMGWLSVINTLKASYLIKRSNPQWPLNWYQRWQVLLQLSGRNVPGRERLGLIFTNTDSVMNIDANYQYPSLQVAPVIQANLRNTNYNNQSRRFYVGLKTHLPDDIDAWSDRLERCIDT